MTLLGIRIKYLKLGVIYNNSRRPTPPVSPPSLLPHRPDGYFDG